jgi:soluble lytic murein transglycosylase-like protein
VKEAGSKYKIRRSVILSIINAESEFNRFAFSSSKARGLMQIMAFNYKGNPQDLYDPYINILTGTRIFREYLDLAKSDYGVALKNYNSGPNSKYYNLEYIRKVLMYVKKVDPVFAIFEMESSIDFLNL